MITAANPKITETLPVRIILIGVSLVFLGIVLVVPLATIIGSGLAKGFAVYWSSVTESDALSAIRLTLLAAAISVPLNMVFGVFASWTIAKFDFVGKKLLMTLIDLPFTVSPVISGLIFVLLFGAQGLLGPWLGEHDIKVLFAVPGWRTFWHVTLPNIKWGLLYGVILLNARAMGEFGAVSVVSGHIRGLTNTIPLHVEILYNEYQFVAAFAMASILTLLAVVTLIAKTYVQWKAHDN
jgi:sulfate transport system permease protein